MTGLGVISLAGVVVNNAIVVLDYAEQLRARGFERRTLILVTGMRRLRPVMLTALAALYPSLRAARLRPVVAMSHFG